MSLSKKQHEIIKYHQKYNPLISILEGAVRSGKTHADNILWIDHVSNFKRKDFIYKLLGEIW